MNGLNEGRRGKISFAALAALILFFSLASFAQDAGEDEDDYLSPVRPTVSDSAKIQKKGVLQIESGFDADFDTPDYRRQQANPLGVYYAVNKKFRLDLEFESVVSETDRRGQRETGFGDVQIGFKALLRDDPKKRLAVGLAYSVKLPAADADKNLGTGKVDHNLRLILNRTFGKTDFVFNAAYLNVGRADADKRESGAQTVFTVERELPKNFGVFGEIYGNTADENQPRGIYLNAGLFYKLGKRLVFDIGARPGFGRDAPRIAIYAGLTVGAANLLSRK